jgi:hypothetical protein
VILGHIAGIPVEESVLQLAPAGAAMATVVAIAGRTGLDRLRRRLRHRAQHKNGPRVEGAFLTALTDKTTSWVNRTSTRQRQSTRQDPS